MSKKKDYELLAMNLLWTLADKYTPDKDDRAAALIAIHCLAGSAEDVAALEGKKWTPESVSKAFDDMLDWSRRDHDRYRKSQLN